jgi:RNA polymerase sigma factor (sigma-70 family)
MAERLRPEDLLAHVDWMRRLAMALVHDAEEAKDLAQEGVSAALARPPLDDRPVRPWLAGVLRNLAKLRARGRGRRARREAEAEVGEAAPTPEALVERVRTERRVTELVLALDEPFRSTLLLRYYEGRTAAEIARVHQVPAGTVRWRLKTGLDRIRAELDRTEDRRWRAVLLPLGRRPIPLALPTLLEGVLLMSAKKILAGTAVLLILLLAGRQLLRPEPPPAPGGLRRAPITLRPAVGPRGTQVAATVEPDRPGALRLQGQVIDPAEAPIEGALVAIDSNPPRTAVTDANGVFAFPELRQRLYTLEAQGRELYAGPVKTRVPETGEPVVLRARAATRLEVTVLAKEQPLAGAHVELRSTLVWRADSDGQGVARLYGVGVGFRAMRVEAPGFAPSAQIVVTDAGPAVQRLVVRLEIGHAAAGRVLDPQGRPVPGARVWPRSASEPFPVVDPAFDAVTSDGEGRWRIGALAAGSYQFLAAHPEFAQAVSAPVAVNHAVDGIDLRLEAGGLITGLVRSADGKPVAGAEVRAAALSGMAIWPALREVFSDDDGRFRLDGLPRRAVQLTALHESGASPMVTADLAARLETAVELTLSVRGEIAGIVVDGRGQPLAEAQVTARHEELWARGPIKSGNLTSWDLRGIPILISDAGGRFRFSGLPEGAYTLQALRPGAPPDQRALVAGVKARTGDGNVRLVVRGDGRVTGRVVLEDGTAAPAFSVSFGGVAPTPFTGTDGAFSLSGPAGQHDLIVTGPTFATKELENVQLEEGAGKDLGTITVKRGRSISGRVLAPDGTPVAEAQVVAAAWMSGGGTKLFIRDESGPAQQTTSDADGRFTLSGFEPGKLVLVAERTGVGRSSTISVPPQPLSAQVDLVLRETGSLEGKVTRDGQPFADTVVITAARGTAANFFVMTGPDGRYALDTLAPGPQTVLAFVNRRKDMVTRAVTVEAGRRASADLEVRTGPITLSVRVQGSDGQPASGEVMVVSPPFPVAANETVAVVRERFAPVEPTTVYLRGGKGAAEVEGLPAGLYQICAARKDGPLACKQQQLTASTTVELVVAPAVAASP